MFKFWKKKEEKKSTNPETTYVGGGVLFGLNPPPDCYFEVKYSNYSSGSWHVKITNKDGHTLSSGFRLAGRYSNGNSDEQLIKAAATEALDSYEQKRKREHLQGCYPPKVAY